MAFNKFTTAAIVVSLGFGCKATPTNTTTTDKKSEVVAAASALENAGAPTRDTPLKVGETVYDFSALAHTGQRFKLSSFLHGPVLIYFCEQDRASACTQLSQNIRDSWVALQPHISMVFGVSPEPTLVHREFVSTQKLSHLMLSDGQAKLRPVFGLKPKTRLSYLIGKDRKVLHIFTPLPTEDHAQQLVGVLKRLDLLKPPPPM